MLNKLFNLVLTGKPCSMGALLLRHASIFVILMKPSAQNPFVLWSLRILQWRRGVNLNVSAHCTDVDVESARQWNKSRSGPRRWLGGGCPMLLSLLAPKHKCLTNTCWNWNADETLNIVAFSWEYTDKNSGKLDWG